MNINPAEKDIELAGKGGEQEEEPHGHDHAPNIHVEEEDCAMADDTRTVYLD
jgi:hypothetical protein